MPREDYKDYYKDKIIPIQCYFMVEIRESKYFLALFLGGNRQIFQRLGAPSISLPTFLIPGICANRLTNCQGLSLTVKELTILSRGKNEKYGNVKEKITRKI